VNQLHCYVTVISFEKSYMQSGENVSSMEHSVMLFIDFQVDLCMLSVVLHLFNCLNIVSNFQS
jgi:hypothetical protein